MKKVIAVMLAAIATLLNTNPAEARQYWHTDDSGGITWAVSPATSIPTISRWQAKSCHCSPLWRGWQRGFPYQQEYGVADAPHDSQQYQRMRHAPFRLEPA